MTLSLSRLFAFTDHLLWERRSHRLFQSDPHRRSCRDVLDPATLPESLQRDLGLLDGRGPSNRRPERDPRLGPWEPR
jgi:hypothetical protein